jgi:hypothetical protein
MQMNISDNSHFFWRNESNGSWGGWNSMIFANSAGNVGIGTINPASILDVEGANPISVLKDTSGTGYAFVDVKNTSGRSLFGVESNAGGSLLAGSTGNATVLGSVAATPLQFGTSDTVRMTIAANGSVVVNGALSAGSATVGGSPVCTANGANCPGSSGGVTANGANQYGTSYPAHSGQFGYPFAGSVAYYYCALSDVRPASLSENPIVRVYPTGARDSLGRYVWQWDGWSAAFTVICF